MSDQPVAGKAADPLVPWRELRDVYIDVWAKAMSEAVNSEAYSQASGAVLDTCLTASAPLRDAQRKTMISALEQLNIPSRTEFVSLAERLANVELLLDDMAAKLDEIHQAVCRADAPKASSEVMKSEAPETAKSESVMPEVTKLEAMSKSEETTESVAQPVSSVSEAGPVMDEGATQHAAQPEPEMKSAARRIAIKSVKKGTR